MSAPNDGPAASQDRSDQVEPAIGDLTTTRIEAFSDGVFSIVITLLAFNIRIPDLPRGWTEAQLRSEMAQVWPKLLSYVLSFAMVGVYWVGHHNIFHHVKRSNRTLLWINMLFLMCVAFLPFPASLLGQYGSSRIAVEVYGMSLIATGLSLQLLWSYTTRAGRLVDKTVDRTLMRSATRRILLVPMVSVVAILLSLLNPRLSLLLYVLVPVFYVLPAGVDKVRRRRHARHRPVERPTP